MDTNNHSTVVATFDDYAHAKVVIDKLWHAGFAHDHVGIVGPGHEVKEARTPEGEAEHTAAKGAATGAVAGGTVGAVAGALMTGLIPGAGPFIAGGLLGGLLTGAAFGAAGGTFLGPFVALGLTEEDARLYESRFKAGKTIVAVRAGDRVGDAIAILQNNGGRDVKHWQPELSTSGGIR